MGNKASHRKNQIRGWKQHNFRNTAELVQGPPGRHTRGQCLKQAQSPLAIAAGKDGRCQLYFSWSAAKRHMHLCKTNLVVSCGKASAIAEAPPSLLLLQQVGDYLNGLSAQSPPLSITLCKVLLIVRTSFSILLFFTASSTHSSSKSIARW